MPEKCQRDGKDRCPAARERAGAASGMDNLSQGADSEGLLRMMALLRDWTRRVGRTCIPLTAMLFGLPLAAATLTPAPVVHDVDWRTSPLDLNLRGLNGERFRFRCPPGPAEVPPLLITTEEGERLFEEGRERYEAFKKEGRSE